MLEKEVKILEIDVDAVIQRIEALGWIKTFEGFLHDEYFDFVWNKMDENDRSFRIRKKWDTHLYTIKRKRKHLHEGGEKWVRIADEREEVITNVESFKKVLETYGLEKIREKKKHRISYLLDAIVFDIDIYEGIPPFLEIEGQWKKDIEKYIKKLWLQKHPVKTFWSRGLFKYYKVDYSYVIPPNKTKLT